MVNIEDLKLEAKRILNDGHVKYIIGYKENPNHFMSMPAFIKKAEEVDQLVWDPTCVHNLARFLVDEKRRKAREKEPDNRPVGIILKGCDSRALVVLLQEEYLKREDVYVLGISCENIGIIDEKKVLKKYPDKKIKSITFNPEGHIMVNTKEGKIEVSAEEVLADRCLECQANFPVIKDIGFGEEIKKSIDKPFAAVTNIESLSQEKKWAFWKEQFDKCIRCYACRSVCPMCYCEECVVDTINFAVTADTSAEEKARKIKWIEKSAVLSENFIYHLVRAMHLAGRCVDCGECERVCPVEIPIRLLNKKLEKEAEELFDYQAGFDPEKPSLVSSYSDEDPEDFIR
ncbi:MAG: 4Fe-4S dicluster domain-containing protein [Candidatus Aminicenantes bacterium]|nr:4Fe-4S dicluster domain-containing protein [Candidatus Aminicenantes bacterium]